MSTLVKHRIHSMIITGCHAAGATIYVDLPDRGDGVHVLAQLEAVEDGGLSCRVQAQHQQTSVVDFWG